MPFFTPQHSSKKTQNSWHVPRFLGGLATFFLLFLLFCAVVPSPLMGIFQTPSPHTKHYLRLAQVNSLPKTSENIQNLEATIAIHLMFHEGNVELALPAFTVVETAEGTFSINWPQLFGYSMQKIQPMALPSLWDYPLYSFENLQKNIQPNASTRSTTPQQTLEQRSLFNDTTWCTLSLHAEADLPVVTSRAKMHTPIGKRLEGIYTSIMGSNAFLCVDILKYTLNSSGLSTSGFVGLPSRITDSDALSFDNSFGNEYTLYVSDAEYIDLATSIYNTLKKDSAGKLLLITPAYSDGIKSFFQTSTRYSFLHNNAWWVGTVLKTIQAPTPLWTNLPFFIRWHLPSPVSPSQITP